MGKLNNEQQIGFEVSKEKLKKLVNKKELYFTKRCNKSIDVAISLALNKLDSKKDSKTEKFLLIQEEGGWITYRNYAKKHKMTLINLKMNGGRILLNDLLNELKFINNKSNGSAVLIMHSLPGYSYAENMRDVQKIILNEELNKENKFGRNIVLINDCCGSIGTSSAKIGDIIVCSFGEAKPLSIGKEGASGGFIAADNFSDFSKSELPNEAEKEVINSDIIDFQKLNSRIDSLQERLLRWHSKAKEIKKELIKKGFSILNKEEGGINVLAEFSDEDEKERLINYCRENNVEYTECPRYIRTNKKALSLEIKRIDL